MTEEQLVTCQKMCKNTVQFVYNSSEKCPLPCRLTLAMFWMGLMYLAWCLLRETPLAAVTNPGRAL